MPDQGGIQLLPESRRKIEIKTPGENRWLYAGLAALVLVFSIAAVLIFYRAGLEDRVAELDVNLTNLEKQRNKKAEENLLTLDQQLKLTTRLLNDHVFWSKALAKIEALTQPQVQFSTFNYAVLAKQIAAYVSDDSIKDIDLNNVHVLTNGRLEFTIELAFDKNKFIKEQE